jgi:cytoskeletal protein CcmA (bactofilin family)
MSKRHLTEALSVAGSDTIIGSGVKVKGSIVTDTDINFDGNLEGDITAQGNISIGVNAHIRGNLSGFNVVIAGQVKGNVNASGEAGVLATGNVKGDIVAASLAIDSGGIFIGQSSQAQANGSATSQ